LPRPQRSSVWVRGPVWDSAWILNALWLLPIALWLARGYPDPQSGPLDSFYFGLTALFWIGHRLSSTWLAYCTEAYRPLLRSDPVRFVLLPLLVTLACFVVFLPGDAALPWTREERLVAMAVLDYALVTYHFAAQHFGALSLYRMRAERAGSRHARHLDRVFALGVGGALAFLADMLAGSAAYQDLWIGHLDVPTWLTSNQGAVRAAGLSMLFLATAFMLIAEARASHRSLPRVLYILGLAAMVAIALRPRSFSLYLVIWTSQHWVLATGLGVPALVALGFATGFVHYLLDRSVYRMSDPRIRSAARGLFEQRRTIIAAR
jgi:hypothetical protein